MTSIKSTLEIVMEKTKGLKLSNEEKAEIEKRKCVEEVRGRLGLYMERRISVVDLGVTFRSGKEIHPGLGEEFAAELLSFLSLEDNGLVFDALVSIFNAERRELEEIVKAAAGLHEQRKEQVTKEEFSRLKACGIKGSAVLPVIAREDDDILAGARASIQRNLNQ